MFNISIPEIKAGCNMDNVKAIIDSKFRKIITDLDKAGAKKISRDTVQKNLDELKVELENHFTAEAENLKNKLVAMSLQDTLTNFRVTTNL